MALYRLQFILAASTLALGVTATPKAPRITAASKKLAVRDSVPASSGSSALSSVMTIATGEIFDGGMFVYDRGVSCTGQVEGGDSDAVFQIENGGSLSNVIIGPNQIEGVHCQGACTLENVWWSAVCEDAFTIKNQNSGETTYIKGGGAFGAEDKVLQHNGGGSLSVSDFTVSNFGKLYRSCGNCDSMTNRHITMSGITASSGSELCGINSNYGDSCTLTGSNSVSDVDDICVTYTGNSEGDEPTENGSGADGTYCIYDESSLTGGSGSGGSDSSSEKSSTTAKFTKTTDTSVAIKTKTTSAASSTTTSSENDEDDNDDGDKESSSDNSSTSAQPSQPTGQPGGGFGGNFGRPFGN